MELALKLSKIYKSVAPAGIKIESVTCPSHSLVTVPAKLFEQPVPEDAEHCRMNVHNCHFSSKIWFEHLCSQMF
jgi:hypothetical protein